MILVSKTYWAGAPFQFKKPPEGARLESRMLRADDFREFHAMYWTPEDRPRPPVAVVCMHPRVDFTHHYTFPRLLAAGIGCLGANTRNPNNDVDTVHEEIVLDLGACVRWLKERCGVEKVVLLGNSGGGSLSALFQAQARLAPGERIQETPGGEPTKLASAELIPADGLVLLSAHRGQGQVLGQSIDPSVVDENDPFAIDPALDMYSPDNGFQPPPAWSTYDPAFVQRFREAQQARVGRLDAVAHELLARGQRAAKQAGAAEFSKLPFAEQQRILQARAFEPVMVVYRTMANPNYVDRHLDPSDRDYGSLLSERPDLMNMKLLGFGRICTPRAWLSTWSAHSSNADLVKNLANVCEPTLVVNAGRDREIYPAADAKPIFEAVAATDKTFLEFPEARHYFEADFGEAESPQAEALMDALVPWLKQRFGE